MRVRVRMYGERLLGGQNFPYRSDPRVPARIRCGGGRGRHEGSAFDRYSLAAREVSNCREFLAGLPDGELHAEAARNYGYDFERVLRGFRRSGTVLKDPRPALAPLQKTLSDQSFHQSQLSLGIQTVGQVLDGKLVGLRGKLQRRPHVEWQPELATAEP